MLDSMWKSIIYSRRHSNVFLQFLLFVFPYHAVNNLKTGGRGLSLEGHLPASTLKSALPAVIKYELCLRSVIQIVSPAFASQTHYKKGFPLSYSQSTHEDHGKFSILNAYTVIHF